MGFDHLWNAFVASFPVLGAAWQTVAGLIIAACVLGWTVGRFMYSERVAGLKDSIENLKTLMQFMPAIGVTTSPAVAAGTPGDEQHPIPAAYGITRASAERMMTVLAGERQGVFVTLDLDASEARNLYSQVVSVFNEAGWTVSSQEIMGLRNPPDCGVALLRSNEVGEAQITLVRKALYMAGIDFEERSTDGDLSVPQVAFTRRDPYWTPSAKWG